MQGGSAPAHIYIYIHIYSVYVYIHKFIYTHIYVHTCIGALIVGDSHGTERRCQAGRLARGRRPAVGPAAGLGACGCQQGALLRPPEDHINRSGIVYCSMAYYDTVASVWYGVI